MNKAKKGIFTTLEVPYGYHAHRNQRDLEKYEYYPDFITFDTTPETSSSAEGTIYWDELTHLPAVRTLIPETTLNLGLESWTPIRNNTGVEIPDGTCVVGVASNDETFDVVPAIATENSITGSYGVVTSHLHTYVEGVETGEGWAATRGVVHGYDTTAFSPFDMLFISDTVAGDLVNIPPAPPSYAIPVGFAMNSKVDGAIYVYASNPMPLVAATNASVASGDPTGWHHGDDIICEYDSSTRTVTLTGELKYSWRGQVHELTAPWTSDPHPATLDKKYFLYSTDGKNFTWSEQVWGFTDIMVVLVYYHTADKMGVREIHGIMPWQVHEEFHKVVHTYRESGGTLDDYALSSTVAADRRPSMSSAVIKDEDCNTTLPDLSSGLYTHMYLTGTGLSTFTKSATDIIPLNVAQPYYNEFVSPNWVQTLMPNNTYSCVWVVAVPATADSESQNYRFLWIQGQHNGSFEEQVALSPSDVALGDLTQVFTEFVFCTKVIIRYTASDWRIEGVYNLTGTSASNVGSPAGVFLSIVSSDATLDGVGTAASPLTVVDDGHNHSQLTSPDGLTDPVVYTDNSGSTFINGTLDCAATITARNAINYYGAGAFYIRNRMEGAVVYIGATTPGGSLYYPYVIDPTADITYMQTSSGTAIRAEGGGRVIITANDNDFIVQDTTDSPSYFIWRDHSLSQLFLGTPTAVATFRSTVDCNSNPITNATSVDMSGALTISSTAPVIYFMESGATPDENWGLVCDAGTMQFQSRSDSKVYQSVPFKVTHAGNVTAAGSMTATAFLGNATTATDADTLDSLHAASFIQTSGTQNRSGNLNMYSTDITGSYTNSAIELREVNQVGATQTAAAYAPALAFHWSGIAQGQIALESDSRFHFRDGNTHSTLKDIEFNDGFATDITLTGGATVSGYSTFSSSLGLGTDMIRAYSGSQLAIGAGESYSVMTLANTGAGEILWLGGENGARVVSSPDNWVSGWAGRYEANLLDATGASSFPGNVTAPGFIGDLLGDVIGNASSATNADTVDGYHVSESAGNSTVVARTASGYIYGNYVNMSGSCHTTGADTGMDNFIGTNGTDTFARSYSPEGARKNLNVGVTAAGSTSDPNTTRNPLILTNHANSPGTRFGNTYWYIHTSFYSSIGSNTITQIAQGYQGSNCLCIRRNFSGTWTSWEYVYSETTAPVSKSTNGYFKTPQGLICNYGWRVYGSPSYNVYYPLSFPTACRSVVCTANMSSSATNFKAISTGTVTNTYFQSKPWTSAGVATDASFYWVAWGY